MSSPLGSPHPSRGWFVLLVVIVVAVVAVGLLRGTIIAGYLLATAVALLAIARLVLPEGAVGPLVVRSRWFDGVLGIGFAVALAVVTYQLSTVI